jgi:hypothetical protein
MHYRDRALENLIRRYGGQAIGPTLAGDIIVQFSSAAQKEAFLKELARVLPQVR